MLAKKSLWQNFLIDKSILSKIVDSIEISSKNIIEIWPWYGALTSYILSNSPKDLTLVEKDSTLVRRLNEWINNWDFSLENWNINLVEGDILDYSPTYNEYNVLWNVPYYITSPIFRHFLYSVETLPQEMTLMVQKDVADKILGWKKLKSSVIWLFIQKKMTISRVTDVSRFAFSPAPKVESTVLHLKKDEKLTSIEDSLFLKVIKIGFSAPRKKLISNLKNGGYEIEKLKEVFEKKWIWDSIRAEDLSVHKWWELISWLYE